VGRAGRQLNKKICFEINKRKKENGIKYKKKPHLICSPSVVGLEGLRVIKI